MPTTSNLKEDIYNYIVQYGPILTSDISKYFKIDTMYAGAYLSELVSNKKIKYSDKKVGGSPLYYVEEQKTRLEFSLRGQLNQREQEVVDMLKSSKVVKEDLLSPVHRVVVKDLKDFAIQLIVNYKGRKETFWKWHLVTKEEAESVLRNVLNKEEKKEETVEKPEPEKTKSVEAKPEPKPEVKSEPVKQDVEKPARTKIIEDKKPEDARSNGLFDKLTKENLAIKAQLDNLKKELELIKTLLPKPEEKKPGAKDPLAMLKKEQDEIKSLLRSSLDEFKSRLQEFENAPKLGPVAKAVPKEEASEQPEHEYTDETRTVDVELSLTNFIDFDENMPDSFARLLADYFRKDSITIDKIRIVKPETLVECIVRIPTPLGPMTYLCDARAKKSIQEADLSSAFLKGQLNHLPVLFVTTGKMSKKAESVLQNFKTMIVKQGIK